MFIFEFYFYTEMNNLHFPDKFDFVPAAGSHISLCFSSIVRNAND